MTWIKDREKVSEREINKGGRISLKEKHENFIAAVKKWEMLDASKVKKSGIERKKKKIEQEQKQHFFFVTTYDISFIKRELGSFTL